MGGEDPRRRAYAEEIRALARGLPISFIGHRADLREIMIPEVSEVDEPMEILISERLLAEYPIHSYPFVLSPMANRSSSMVRSSPSVKRTHTWKLPGSHW